MQVAAAMARDVTGEDLSATLDGLFTRVGASDASGFPDGDNVRYSAGARASADDYALILQGVLSGALVSDLAAFARPRSGTDIAFQPRNLETSNRDWRYGFGFWIECDTVPFSDNCARTPTLLTAGARGFTPWIDTAEGYWAIIATGHVQRA